MDTPLSHPRSDDGRNVLTSDGLPGTTPTLADQVSRLYDLRRLSRDPADRDRAGAGRMGSGDVEPGRHIRRAGKGIGTDRFYTDVLCRTAFSFGLPRIFVDLVLPRLPGLNARLQDGGRLLAVGCCGGWALVQIAERFPATFCVGIDVEPYSIELARQLIAERGLTDRCQTRLQRVDELDEDEVYDPGY